MRDFIKGLLIFLLFHLITGCNLDDPVSRSQRVPILFPPIPPNLKNFTAFSEVSLPWKIRLECRFFLGDRLRMREFGLKETLNRAIYITLDKGLNNPITCRLMVVKNGEEVLDFKEAGGIFPFDVVTDSNGSFLLRLTYEKGPVAKIFMEMSLSGVRVERINTPKLYAEFEKLELDDPWSLDWGYVKYRLSMGSFRKSYFRVLDSYEFNLEGFSGGQELIRSGEVWSLNTPFSGSHMSDENGNVTLSLSPGFYTLFSLDKGSLKCMDLSLNDRGNLEIFPRMNK